MSFSGAVFRHFQVKEDLRHFRVISEEGLPEFEVTFSIGRRIEKK
jgi:hypothetical protein